MVVIADTVVAAVAVVVVVVVVVVSGVVVDGAVIVLDIIGIATEVAVELFSRSVASSRGITFESVCKTSTFL